MKQRRPRDGYGVHSRMEQEIERLRAVIKKAARDAAVTNADPMLVSNLHEALEARQAR